jgi:NitT/TauT family transport system substrate-binding protein
MFISSAIAGQKLKTVEIKKNWIPNCEFMPEMLGEKKGFYKDYDLKVKLVPGNGSADAIKAVANNRQSFGVANAVTTMVAISKGLPIKVVACIYQKSPIALIFRKDSGINSPKDLEGKKVVSHSQSGDRQHFFVFLEKNNVDIDKVDILTVNKELEQAFFISGKVDARYGFLFNQKTILEEQGLDIDWMLFHDYGVKSLNQCLIVNQKTIKEKPKFVKDVVRATMKSWKYAIQNPEEAADAFIEKYPDLKRESELSQFRDSIPFAQTSTVKKQGFGYMSLKSWQETYETAVATGMLKKEINIKEVYTNEFLD